MAGYLDILAALDDFAAGDNSALARLVGVAHTVESSYVQRVANHAHETLVVRLRSWVATMESGFRRVRSPHDLELVLTNARIGFRPILQFAQCPGFPDAIRESLMEQSRKVLAEVADQVREDAERALRRGDEATFRAIRSVPLTEAAVLAASGVADLTSPNSGAGAPIPAPEFGGIRPRQILL